MSTTEDVKDIKSAKEEEKDDLAILDALDKEASEYNKVHFPKIPQRPPTKLPQDAEIDRILKAFKLDA